VKRLAYVAAALVSICLLVAASRQWLPMSVTEVLGFITGAACVWLTVKENVWNWPIGIANSVFFIVLFLNARLFADMALQVVYVVLGFLGWYWWKRGGVGGGEHKQELPISRASARTLAVVALLVAGSTWGLTFYLRSVHDAAPFLDALTTALSLAAQFLLTRKHIENWLVWITADVIYIGLYAYKGLYLTSILYIIFLTMCVIGLRAWLATYRAGRVPAAPLGEASHA
jgi:nicotinamide mononucleotide transporter